MVTDHKRIPARRTKTPRLLPQRPAASLDNLPTELLLLTHEALGATDVDGCVNCGEIVTVDMTAGIRQSPDVSSPHLSTCSLASVMTPDTTCSGVKPDW